MRQNPYSSCLAEASFFTHTAGPQGTTSVVHLLNIACPVARLHEFMRDARQWLPWTVPALQSVQPLPFGQWLLKTTRTVRKLRLCPAATHNELRYEVVVPGLGSCHTQVHISATPQGCQLTITHHKHELLPLRTFALSTRHALRGLRALKQVLEQA